MQFPPCSQHVLVTEPFISLPQRDWICFQFRAFVSLTSSYGMIWQSLLFLLAPNLHFDLSPRPPFGDFWNDLWRPFSFLSFFLKIFIYLVLNRSSQDLWSSLFHMEYLVVACGIQFPDQGSNPKPPVLGVWSLYFLLSISHSFTLTALWSMKYLFPRPQTYESYVPPIKYKFYLTLVTWIFLKI